MHRQHISILLLVVPPLLRVHDLLQEDLVFRAHLLQGLLGAVVAGGLLAAAQERHVVAIGEIQLGFFAHDGLDALEVALVLVLLVEAGGQPAVGGAVEIECLLHLEEEYILTLH